jgi:hypothetical protein
MGRGWAQEFVDSQSKNAVNPTIKAVRACFLRIQIVSSRIEAELPGK